MDWQKDKQNADYLAPDISELSRQRGGRQNDPNNMPQVAQGPTITRHLAKRLLPACLVTPVVLWWVLFFGQHRGWYDLDTCFVLFVFSVTVAFGAIVCLNLRRLSKLDGERAAAEQQLKIAKEAAESANRFKSAFFANISHEIRTPLTAINGFAELILHPKRTPDERLADARVIRRNGEHLLTLINDILDLSKIEAGKMSVDRISCCPAAVIGEVCAMMRHRASEKGLTLSVTFEGSIPTSIRTDPTRLRQILINLISNATKFTREGGVAVAVSITPNTSAERPLLQMQITDSGIGIPADRIDALFQPFVQADASITRQFGGTGLGLTISRYFSRALGGDIAVTSQPGRGSTFTVTLETDSLVGVPLEARPEQAMEDLQEAFSGPQVRIAGSILVAEDGIDNQALITARLRQTGLSVEIANNGQIACEKALAALNAQRPFDLILMDVQMPVMDGFTATLNLRSRGYRGPIIALTANAGERDRDKCLNAGCNDFVTKPIKLEMLFKAMGRYLTVEPVKDEPAQKFDTSSTASPETKTRQFMDKLPEELEQIEQAIERQDRAQLTEVVQLIVGTASALGLKECVAEASKLLQLAKAEPSWVVLRKAAGDFAKETQGKVEAKVT